jgi:DNA-binding NarL/FixJ family response regulator
MISNQTDKQEVKKARVLIVDDHPIIRQGLRELIDQEPDLEVCGEAENAIEALKAIRTLNPDVALVDISLNKDMSGFDLIKDVKYQYPNLPTLVLSMHDESIFAERVLRAGGRGYVMKEEATEKVLIAIRKVLGGGIYLSDRVTSKMLSKISNARTAQEPSGVELLSDRELEVFELIGQGLGTQKIAERLNLSVKTVEAHRMHIREKLKLKDATELLQHAIQWTQNEKIR